MSDKSGNRRINRRNRRIKHDNDFNVACVLSQPENTGREQQTNFSTSADSHIAIDIAKPVGTNTATNI